MTFELYRNDEIKGVFSYNGNYFEFYPEKVIREYMIKNQFHFTLQEIAPNENLHLLIPSLSVIEVKKQIQDKQKAFLIKLVNSLIKDKEIEGAFDNDKLCFDSFDWTFARSFEEVVKRCSAVITPHFKQFEHTHNTIKNVLMDKRKALSPKAVDVIDNEIKKIQSKFESWRGDVYGIIGRANNNLFNKKNLDKLSDAPPNLTCVEDDPHLSELLEKFESWTHLINEIEFKYGSVIYYQKWLDKNPDSKETQKKLISLYKTLQFQ